MSYKAAHYPEVLYAFLVTLVLCSKHAFMDIPYLLTMRSSRVGVLSKFYKKEGGREGEKRKTRKRKKGKKEKKRRKRWKERNRKGIFSGAFVPYALNSRPPTSLRIFHLSVAVL